MNKIVNNSTRLSSEEFVSFAKRMIQGYYIKLFGSSTVSSDEIFLVWYCKTLQNRKALLYVTGQYSEYFEAIYDDDKNKIYLVTYKKDKNIVAEPIRIE